MTRAARGQMRLVEIACRIMQETEKAIAIADGTTEPAPGGGGRERQKWFWLPLSQIEIDRQRDGTAIVTMPEWLALERGLI